MLTYILIGLVWTFFIEVINEVLFVVPFKLYWLSRLISVLMWPLGMIIFAIAFYESINKE